MKGEIKMISAKEAYDLSAPNLDIYRAFIANRIREAASNREDPYNMWLYGTADELAKAVVDAWINHAIKEVE